MSDHDDDDVMLFMAGATFDAEERLSIVTSERDALREALLSAQGTLGIALDDCENNCWYDVEGALISLKSRIDATLAAPRPVYGGQNSG